jgi:ATP-dependent 26S proteasome regulatory subunit
VISKYLGDTAKHIKRAFERASHHGAVLFLDEADSLPSTRISFDESCSTSINQDRNCLMQELDRFEGVVVMTTNLFGNYDDSLLRRVPIPTRRNGW